MNLFNYLKSQVAGKISFFQKNVFDYEEDYNEIQLKMRLDSADVNGFSKPRPRNNGTVSFQGLDENLSTQRDQSQQEPLD